MIAADGSSQGEPSHPTRLARTAHGSGRVTGPLGGRFFCVCPGCQATASTAGAGRSAGRSNKAAQGAPIKKPRRRQGLSRNASGSLSSFRPRKWCPALLTRTDLTVRGKGWARAWRSLSQLAQHWHTRRGPSHQGRNGITCRAIGPCGWSGDGIIRIDGCRGCGLAARATLPPGPSSWASGVLLAK